MDATPLSLGQEVSGWRAQIELALERLRDSEKRLLALAQGGTAIGTGINAHEKFAASFIEELRGADLGAVQYRRQLFRCAGHAGCGRGILGTAAHAGRDADEDLQRPALDGFRPAGGAGRAQAAGIAARQQHHAGQGEPGDSRSRDHDRRAGHGSRCRDRHRRPVGQLPVERDVAADRAATCWPRFSCSPTAHARWPNDAWPAPSPMSRDSTMHWRAIPFSQPRSIR